MTHKKHDFNKNDIQSMKKSAKRSGKCKHKSFFCLFLVGLSTCTIVIYAGWYIRHGLVFCVKVYEGICEFGVYEK